MRMLFGLTVFLLISLNSLGCRENNIVVSESIADFSAKIDTELERNLEIGNIEVEVILPPNLVGYILLASPYAITGNETNLTKIFGKIMTEKLSVLTQDNSAYHKFIVVNNELVVHERWQSPPVAFNDLFVEKFSADKKLLRFTINDAILSKITAE